MWGESVGGWSGGSVLDGWKRRPPRSVAATVACSFSGEDGDVSALAGATAATAEATAARRANSRREMPLEADGSLGSSLISWSLALFFRFARRLLKGCVRVNLAN